MRRPAIFFAAILTGVGIDLFSKWYIFARLAPFEVVGVIPGVLHIVRAENHGVAFSMLSGHHAAICTISIVAITIMIWLYSRYRRTTNTINLITLALLLIGAIGNLIDRLAFDYVRDFIDFVPRIPFIGHWAVFNVADICITCGAIVYAIREIFLHKEHPAPAETRSHIGS